MMTMMMMMSAISLRPLSREGAAFQKGYPSHGHSSPYHRRPSLTHVRMRANARHNCDAGGFGRVRAQPLPTSRHSGCIEKAHTPFHAARRRCTRTPQRVTGASPSSQSASASTVPWEERRKAIPTYLTWLRVLATPAVGVAYCTNATWGMPVPAALAIFVAAAITDWLDGVLARKWDAMTPFGAFLDPVADKVMVCTSLVLLCSRTPAALTAAPAWLLALPTCAIVGREIAVSALREWAATMPKGNNGDEGSDADDVAIPVSIWGKLKTATQLVAISFLLLGAGPSAFASAAVESAVKVGVVLLYISAALALASGADYAKGVMNR